MIKLIGDTHTHTVATDHAFSTIGENTLSAREKGLGYLCLTEHTPQMPGGPSELFFSCMRNLPRRMNGVVVIRGAELNIMDYKGGVDLPPWLLQQLEWVIASYHRPCLPTATELEHTRGWVAIAENPDIDVIGHCGDPRYPFERKTVLQAFKDGGKIVEINAHSFYARKGSRENCTQIAILCAELGIPIVVSSDAHTADAIGDVAPALEMLETIGFPEELILNANEARFQETIRRTGGIELSAQ